MPSLDHGSYSGADTIVTVAGWGVTTEDGSSPDVLHSVDLTLLTNAQCENYGYSGDLVDSMICAIGDLKGGEDACQGDSGGPLLQDFWIVGDRHVGKEGRAGPCCHTAPRVYW